MRLRWLHETYKTPPAAHIAKLPKPTSKDNQKGSCSECGGYHGLPAVHLDYMGHAEVTDVLLYVDPDWSWRPAGIDEAGQPVVITSSNGSVMWGYLTIWGKERLGVGTSAPKGPDTMKELIGDLLRNCAMRFGIGLDLWSKADGVDRRIEAGQHVEPDSDHGAGTVTAPEAVLGGELTRDGIAAMTKRELVERLNKAGLPTHGKDADLKGRLWDWAKASAVPSDPDVTVPPGDAPESGDDHQDDDEPPQDGEGGAHGHEDPPGAIMDDMPDDLEGEGKDDEVGGPELAHQPDEPDPQPVDEPGDDADGGPADENTVRIVKEEIGKLSGVQARAYAAYRRERKLPTKPDDLTDGQAMRLLQFLDELVPATA